MSARPEAPGRQIDPQAEGPSSRVMSRAGRLLAVRPRSTRELKEKLLAAGFDPGEVEDAATRLAALGLLDDSLFAEELTSSRLRQGRRSAAVIAAELEDKGVAPEHVEAALEAVDDRATARRLAVDQAVRMGALPLEVQARRLYGALARRGFDEEVIQDAIRSVLPPEGWD